MGESDKRQATERRRMKKRLAISDEATKDEKRLATSN